MLRKYDKVLPTVAIRSSRGGLPQHKKGEIEKEEEEQQPQPAETTTTADHPEKKNPRWWTSLLWRACINIIIMNRAPVTTTRISTTRSNSTTKDCRHCRSRNEALPLTTESPLASPKRRMRRRRRRFFNNRRCLVVFVSVYGMSLYIWIQRYIPPMQRGYSREEQQKRLWTMGSLALLPLTPLVRHEYKKFLPWQQQSNQQLHIVHANNVSLIVMPSLIMMDREEEEEGADDNHDPSLDRLSLGSELNGVTPKFILSLRGHSKKQFQTNYLFKPSHDEHTVWNEWLAYLVDQTAGFDRVPMVRPYEISWSEIQHSIAALQYTHQSLFALPFQRNRAARALQRMEKWKRRSDQDNNNNNNTVLIGTLQLMAPGVTKRSRMIQRIRNKIGTWTDPEPCVFAQREIATRSLFDYIIGNYDRYNNDFVQVQHPSKHSGGEERLLIYIDQGSFTHEKALQTNLYKITDYCRFYYQPIHKLRSIESLQGAVLNKIRANNITRAWMDQGIIHVQEHPTMKYMNDRVKTVLAVADECVAKYGHDHVFLQSD